MTLPQLHYCLTKDAVDAGCEFKSPRQGDAGHDICASSNVLLLPGQSYNVATGLRLALPEGTVGIIKDRSSLAMKEIYTHGGVIDESYRGEIVVMMSNNGQRPHAVFAGDRIAQMIICPYIAPLLMRKKELPPSERGTAGFGSTGV